MRRKLITSYLIIIIFLFRIFRCWNQFRPMQFDLPWRISRTRTSGQSVRRCLEVLTTSIENLLDATFIQSVPPVSKFIHCSQTKRFHLICKLLLPLFLLLMCADFQHVCASYDVKLKKVQKSRKSQICVVVLFAVWSGLKDSMFFGNVLLKRIILRIEAWVTVILSTCSKIQVHTNSVHIKDLFVSSPSY